MHISGERVVARGPLVKFISITFSTSSYNPCLNFMSLFQLSTWKNEINLFNNHVLIVAPVTSAPAGATPPSVEFWLTELSAHDTIMAGYYLLTFFVCFRMVIIAVGKPCKHNI